MKPSDELLAIRERCAAEWDRFAVACVIQSAKYHAWLYLDAAIGDWLEDGVLVNGWPHIWALRPERTRLEVVEMIERAAVCALRDEGRL